jgi:hypothetical protein
LILRSSCRTGTGSAPVTFELLRPPRALHQDPVPRPYGTEILHSCPCPPLDYAPLVLVLYVVSCPRLLLRYSYTGRTYLEANLLEPVMGFMLLFIANSSYSTKRSRAPASVRLLPTSYFLRYSNGAYRSYQGLLLPSTNQIPPSGTKFGTPTNY